MAKDRRKALVDRRSGTDRRNVYVLGYFINGGVERRSGRERRSQVERRTGWMREENGCSVLIESNG